VIKHVRRTHLIDDRLENARKESISKNYTTITAYPSSLSHPLLTKNSSEKKP